MVLAEAALLSFRMKMIKTFGLLEGLNLMQHSVTIEQNRRIDEIVGILEIDLFEGQVLNANCRVILCGRSILQNRVLSQVTMVRSTNSGTLAENLVVRATKNGQEPTDQSPHEVGRRHESLLRIAKNLIEAVNCKTPRLLLLIETIASSTPKHF